MHGQGRAAGRSGQVHLHHRQQEDQHQDPPDERLRAPEPSQRHRGRRRHHPAGALRLLPRVAVGEAGDGQPHLLQRDQGQLRAEARPPPEVDVQAVPPVLQLAGHGAGPRPLPVRAQARLLGGREPAQGAQRGAPGCPLLFVNVQKFVRLK